MREQQCNSLGWIHFNFPFDTTIAERVMVVLDENLVVTVRGTTNEFGIIEFTIESGLLFTWVRNRSGSKIISCGTLKWTSNESVFEPVSQGASNADSP